MNSLVHTSNIALLSHTEEVLADQEALRNLTHLKNLCRGNIRNYMYAWWVFCFRLRPLLATSRAAA